ncbi:MAG: hypothetical protein ACQ5SW_08375 [Sphaerochaetaceae bacterium]
MKHTRMMQLMYLLPVNIHQFGEEEEGAGAAPGTAESVAAGDGDQQNGTQPQEDDLSAEFEAMITGEGKYKDVFESRTQGIIDKRFKKSKAMEAEYDQLKTDHESVKGQHDRLSEAMKRKYGTETVDEAIAKMDAESMEAEAYERAVDVSVIKAERENEQLKKDLANANSRLQQRDDTYAQRVAFQKQVEKWRGEETEIKAVYPDFSLEEASANDKFAKLIASNVDMKTAYEVVFKDQIQQNAINNAQNKNRPKENAAEKNPKREFTIEKRAKDMTEEERKDAIQRMRRGEKVRLD